MPSHQDRREPLPKGYQFGDCGKRQYQDYDRLVEAMDKATVIVGDPIEMDLRTMKIIEQPFAPGLTLRAQGDWSK
jgi:hypothetical protein